MKVIGFSFFGGNGRGFHFYFDCRNDRNLKSNLIWNMWTREHSAEFKRKAHTYREMRCCGLRDVKNESSRIRIWIFSSLISLHALSWILKNRWYDVCMYVFIFRSSVPFLWSWECFVIAQLEQRWCTVLSVDWRCLSVCLSAMMSHSPAN